MLNGKHIILGVTGGIAAYKIPLLIRLLKKAKAEVKVVMTKPSAQFVTAETLATLSGNEVVLDIFPPEDSVIKADTWHVKLRQWADAMLIAPATANTIAKLAHGYADNAVTMLTLALRSPLILSPAMDVDMWNHQATQTNLSTLRQLGYFVLPPETGELASGLVGEGRMPEVESLVKSLDTILSRSYEDLRGKHILVTAGPTHESLDPVRFIGNRSSGKMGFALAQAATLRGAHVTLISGPVHLATPNNVRRVDVESTEQMFNAVMKHRTKKDVIIMSAAVADYTPQKVAKVKIKKEEMKQGWVTVLKKTPDILATLGEKKSNGLLVGFALETDNGVKNAKEKLKTKNLDFIVLNNALEEGAAFGVDTNIVSIISRNGKLERFPKMSKFDVANAILDRVAKKLK
ncbi:MAG: bifunctional phosphopantothenoylcysteine decarboxylase/phosphopantothenate--cysteine ligase CoaBC [Ignavibacteriales bacterium]|nr:bifunctional phosphopantothenoylcysteine decarboxylase/phosphopantothenate--cysteine ligase CoaBC [Ignavibacteriales bacterium]